MYDTSEVSSGSASAHALVARKSHTCQRHASCQMVVSVLMDCLIEEPMDWFHVRATHVRATSAAEW